MRKPVMTQDQVMLAAYMLENGISQRKIAKHFNVSRGTIQNYLNPTMRDTRREYNREYNKYYYNKTKEIRLEWQSNYRKCHKSERNAGQAKRRAIINFVTIGDLDKIKEVYRQAREDEGLICPLCGKVIDIDDRHVDHIHPLSKGGAHSVENLQITHSLCNMIKHDKVLGGGSSYE